MIWSAKFNTTVGSFNLDVDLESVRSSVAVEPLCLVGPNGSGKSTFLRAMTGGVGVTAGKITVGKMSVVNTTKNINMAPEQRGIGFVPQGGCLFPHLSVVRNVAFGVAKNRFTMD